MAESVQPTGRAVRRLEPLAIEIPGEPEPSNSYDAFCDRHFSAENMETKTKIYISLLLILPSLIYFLVVINFPNPKRVHVEVIWKFKFKFGRGARHIFGYVF